jgi:hypothetical protein
LAFASNHSTYALIRRAFFTRLPSRWELKIVCFIL